MCLYIDALMLIKLRVQLRDQHTWTLHMNYCFSLLVEKVANNVIFDHNNCAFYLRIYIELPNIEAQISSEILYIEDSIYRYRGGVKKPISTQHCP
jgi:hypothetical protein